MGRTSKNIKLRIPEKPRKIKGFRSGSYRVATTISSNFETVPLRRHIEAVHGSYYALNPLKNQDFLSI